MRAAAESVAVVMAVVEIDEVICTVVPEIDHIARPCVVSVRRIIADATVDGFLVRDRLHSSQIRGKRDGSQLIGCVKNGIFLRIPDLTDREILVYHHAVHEQTQMHAVIAEEEFLFHRVI